MTWNSTDVWERFLTNVQFPNESSGCWTWKGYLSKAGYGLFTLDGKRIGAHRASWDLHHGKIPNNHDICHECDNPSCVRPDHLAPKPHVFNLADMIAKGRSARGDRNGLRRHPERIARGEKCGASRLTSNQVIEIRQLGKSGKTPREISKVFQISEGNVRHILKGDSWKHLL